MWGRIALTALNYARRYPMALIVVLCVLVLVLMLAVAPFIALVLMIGGAAQDDPACAPGAGSAPAVTATQVPEAVAADAASTKLSPAQIETAYAIWQAASATGVGDKGAIIGISTAMQESTLGQNTGATGVGDVGPFQQRALPGWYADGATTEENTAFLANPVNAATTFFEGHTVTAAGAAAAAAAGTQPAGPAGYHIPGLKNISGWQAMSETEAAQAVQRSAFPDAYAPHVPIARQLIGAFGQGGPPKPAEVNIDPATQCAPTGGPLGDCPPSPLPVGRGLSPDAALVLSCGTAKFPKVTDFAGIGDRPATVDDDHQTGKALDFMTYDDKALGQAIADWAKKNAAALGVKYVIFDARIWSTARSAEGWRDCSSGSCYAGPDPTAAHRDHVHISVLGDGAVKAPAGSAGTGPVRLPMAPGSYQLGAWFNKPGSWSSGHHRGTDFLCTPGTPIYAITAGKVRSVSYDRAGGPYGNSTFIESGPVAFRYNHMNKPPAVQAGQDVQPGQQIGECGWTGRVIPKSPSAAHLDLEFTLNGQLADAEAWLRQNGADPGART